MQSWSIFESKWASFFLYFIATFLCILLSFFAILNYCNQTLSIALLVLPLLSASASIFLLIMLLKRWKKDPSLVFLLIAMPTVFAFCLFMLPGAVPDEYAHICRMFSLSTSGVGDMVIPSAFANNTFPTSYEQLFNSLITPFSWTDSFVDGRDMSAYLPQMYILPGLFSELLEALNVNPFVTIYACRGINAILFILGGYWILKLLPLGKTVAFVYLLNPMLMQQEASCSADAFVNLVCLFFIAVVLNARFTEDRLNKLQLAGILVFSILIPCSKYAYTPLLLLLFLLLPRIKSKKTRLAIVSFFVFFVLLASVLVLGFYHSESTLGYSVDLIRDPLLCLSVLANSLYSFAFTYLEQFAGHSLGALSINPWPVFFVLYYCLLTAALLISVGETKQLKKWEKCFTWGITIVSTLLILITMRQWSLAIELRNDILTGVQGRYFLPFALLPLLSLINPKRNITNENSLVGFGVMIIAMQLSSIAAVCIYFL